MAVYYNTPKLFHSDQNVEQESPLDLFIIMSQMSSKCKFSLKYDIVTHSS